MKEFIAESGGLIAAITLVIVCLNVFFKAIDTILEKIKDKTKSDLDNKAYKVVNPIANFLASFLDVLQNKPKAK